MKDFSQTWLDALEDIIFHGHYSTPRGMVTREILHRTIQVDMRKPVLMVPNRKLNYQFMAAEALWILSGDDRVAPIAKYNKRIADFSDDGETFFGAYGPKIDNQLEYVVRKLVADRDSRQAGLTIWRENPPNTKDVPCTVAIFFSIRNSLLNAHVFMRSSDVWLGVPYDVFNFSMLAHLVCAHVNNCVETRVSPGQLYLTAASSHVYMENFDAAGRCLSQDSLEQNKTPEYLFNDVVAFTGCLTDLRDSKPGDPLRWWEV